ncbi:hypothetical protein AX16_008700 [Volvariella volvacea WC 439]|nr:hypothetical protein AX16_008700 [Volvariella volvacea WC 439]
MTIGDHHELIDLAITDLGQTSLFIGYDWLRRHNPDINWETGQIDFNRCPTECDPNRQLRYLDSHQEVLPYPEYEANNQGYEVTYLRSLKTQPVNTELPTHLQEYADVFSKEEFEQLPEQRSWDHAIDLVPGAKPTNCKNYSLTQDKQRELEKFIKTNLASGRIRKSTSPMASPFFFIKKKDGGLQPVQDYRKLNEITIKNKYPLPLIHELLDKVKDCKVFTKFDNKEQQDAFEMLKESIIKEPTLFLPTANGKFRVEADSSEFATGAVLSQFNDNQWRPVAFRSKSLSETERNYEIYDKELLAIMQALDEWRQYLLGSREPFEIWTDHQNLTYFKEPRKLNRRQARWWTELAKYHFTLHHKPGSSMGKADALSRLSHHDHGDDDNKDIVLLKPEWFLRATEIEGMSQGWLDTILVSKEVDNSVIKALANKERRWNQNEGLITWFRRVYVPKNQDLQEEIIRHHHESTIDCEEMSLPIFLQPTEIPTRPWEVIHSDIIGPLPESSGYNAICTFVDRFSKQIHIAPTNMNLTAEGMARLYRDNVFRLHGIPQRIVSDRGKEYETKFTRALFQLLGIEPHYTTAYHPQTNGQAERLHQHIEQYLRLYINYQQDDWSDWLAIAEFTYNDRESASTSQTPFFVNYGIHPYKGIKVGREEVRKPNAQRFANRMTDIHSECKAALERSAQIMKRYYDQHKDTPPTFQPGDLVWLDSENIKSTRPSDKLAEEYHGPLKVIEKVGRSAYRLEIPTNWKQIHPVFNEVLLQPYVPPKFPMQKKNTRPPPDARGEYEIAVLTCIGVMGRGAKRELHYKTQWKGYPSEADMTWEARSELIKHARAEVNHFEELNKDDIRKFCKANKLKCPI